MDGVTMCRLAMAALLPVLLFGCGDKEDTDAAARERTALPQVSQTPQSKPETPAKPAAQPEEYTNSIGMEFVLISAGSFNMGADKNFEDAFDYETPVHRVTISKPFYLGKYEVTQAQWVAVMGNNSSKFKGRNNPVEMVSWDDVQIFIDRLNQKEGHDRYRLPTEAEWEYAARAGMESIFSFGDDAAQLGSHAWYGESWDTGGTHPVGQKQPNAWGLYDMYGNVWELVQDLYGENYYAESPSTDPEGPSSGEYRVDRGCSWVNAVKYCRSASRYRIIPDGRYMNLGFRLALSPDRQRRRNH